MEFIKKNYEKIILGLVLLGLVGVLIGMWFVIQTDVQSMTDLKNTYLSPSAKPLPDLDLSRAETALARLKTPPALDFSTTNKLFNPVQWQKTKDGRMVRAEKLGVQAAVVTKITPLYFSISLASVETNGLAPRYSLNLEDQSAAIPAQRRRRPHYVSLKETIAERTVSGKNEGFTLVAVKGLAENPDELELKLAEPAGEPATLSKEQPFKRVDGYTADLKYDPENLKFTAQRVGDHFSFGGDDYNIIAIDRNVVILLAQSNQRKWPLPYAP
jgi:hypothetical protein